MSDKDQSLEKNLALKNIFKSQIFVLKFVFFHFNMPINENYQPQTILQI
jgi:hypothetical protein